MKQYMLSVPMIDGAPPRPRDEWQQAFEQTAVLNEEMQSAGVWVFVSALPIAGLACLTAWRVGSLRATAIAE